MSVITFVWVCYERAPEQQLQKTGDHMSYIFSNVLPTLPMFLLFPWLQRQRGFYGALGASVVLTIAVFTALRLGAARFGLVLKGETPW